MVQIPSMLHVYDGRTIIVTDVTLKNIMLGEVSATQENPEGNMLRTRSEFMMVWVFVALDLAKIDG